jgi:hypothetical protein
VCECTIRGLAVCVCVGQFGDLWLVVPEMVLEWEGHGAC